MRGWIDSHDRVSRVNLILSVKEADRWFENRVAGKVRNDRAPFQDHIGIAYLYCVIPLHRPRSPQNGAITRDGRQDPIRVHGENVDASVGRHRRSNVGWPSDA